MSECERSGQRRRVAELTRPQVPKTTASAVFGPGGDRDARPAPSRQRPADRGGRAAGRGVSRGLQGVAGVGGARLVCAGVRARGRV